MNSRRSLLVLPSILVVVLCATLPTAGADAASETELAGRDPVVADVIRMLEQQVDPDVIEAWLMTSDARPAPLSPDDLVALSQAQAPESLVLLLLERSESAREDRAEPEPVPSAAAVPGIAATKPVTPFPDGTSRVGFEVTYRPASSATYEAEEVPWGLYVYLDGRPLVFTDGRNSILSTASRPVRFYEELQPGAHAIRILLERHTLASSKKKGRWQHETRVFSEGTEIDLVAGSTYGVEIEVNENTSFWKKDRGPVTIAVTLDDAVLTEMQGVGSDLDAWPALCDDVNASIPEGKKPGPSARRALEDCMSWENLWGPLPGLPDRQAVRETLAAHDYRPVPATLE